MTIRTKGSITGEKLANWAMYLIILILSFPLTMVLPGMIRMSAQVFAAMLFIAALLLLYEYSTLILLLLLFVCSYLYYIAAWEEMMSASTFLYNSLCCWIIVLYAKLCINGRIRSSEMLLKFLLVITLITVITTIIGLQEYPLAVRELGRGASYAGTDIKFLYRSRNIASWSQVYGMVFLQGCFVYYYKKTHSIIVLLTIILTELCIIKSQLTFGLLLSIIILIMVAVNSRSRKYYYVAFAFITISVVALTNIGTILLWVIGLAEKAGLGMMAPKLEDLYNLLVQQAATGDALARIELYSKSLVAFGQYPFGLFWHRNIQATSIIGYHSEFFDVIGALGIFGVILLCVCCLGWLLAVMKISSAYKRRFLIIMFLVFGLMFLLNPVFYSPQIWLGAFAIPALIVNIDYSNHHHRIGGGIDGQPVN